VKDASGKGKVKEKVEKAYKFIDGGKGEVWWTIYWYQMEAFIDHVKGWTLKTWVSMENSHGEFGVDREDLREGQF
jgi:hypothetical protein